MTTTPDLDRLLHERFGFDAFLPGQRAAIEALLDEGRVLCVRPTGAGKSLLYQLPALCVDGLTLVISPLLALVRDQIRHLRHRFGIPAAAINSDQTDDENQAARDAARSGGVRILFVAPEQLDSVLTYRFLMRLPVDLLVVDEAHCISTWGHDFRPSYRRIVDAVRALHEKRPGVRVLGLTATADRRTEQDIAAQLADAGQHPLRILRTGMDRPNLALSTVAAQGVPEKLVALAGVLRQVCADDPSATGIVYCATRDRTDLTARFLREQGVGAVAYHAGLPPADKLRLQQAFVTGEHPVVCATNALGMGIDKPDVRFVVHFDVPGSITAYYQEVGRAGRDGLPARGVLVFDEDDRRIQEHFIRSAQPSREDFDAVQAVVRDASRAGDDPPGLTAVKVRTGLHPTRVTVVLAELYEQGYVDKVSVGRRQGYVWTERPGEPVLTRYERQHEVRGRELASMLGYARGDVDCRMQALRRALGDGDAEACTRCDLCRSERFDAEADAAEARGAAERFLERRAAPIDGSRRPRMAAGMAALDGELRLPLHVSFLRRRADPAVTELDPELLDLLIERARELAREHRFGAVVPVPSRTWAQRDHTARALAAALSCLVYPDVLTYSPEPLHRQGELLNNDQRRQNVSDCLHVGGELGSSVTGPARRAVLLLDDYVGSRATLREAVRVLRRDAGVKGEIVPLAVTRVRWRLGARGMV